jgi:hypothetical protein
MAREVALSGGDEKVVDLVSEGLGRLDLIAERLPKCNRISAGPVRVYTPLCDALSMQIPMMKFVGPEFIT